MNVCTNGFSIKDYKNDNEIHSEEFFSIPPSSLKKSSGNNLEDIEEIFSTKLSQYNELGYFTQIHESSIQATYFALYILDAVGKLNEINQSKIIDFIMGHYNESTHAFIDSYAIRYLDAELTYFSKMDDYVSMLEITCQAVLSLKLLNRLDLIDIQQSINFIESCYNPETGGYIGQPYSSELHPFFKIATAENTYYAILTLEKLGASPGNVDDVVMFLNNLQSLITGGFYNNLTEENPLSYSKTNLLSSYFCIRGLEIIGFEDSIRIDDFIQFLEDRYNDVDKFFELSENNLHALLNFTSSVATALGLYLSDVSGYSGLDRTGVVNFIFNNRNSWGIWNNAREFQYHELIETFQIIRALNESGETAKLNSSERTEIANALKYYEHPLAGYSLLSRDYTSLGLIHSIVNSFKLYDRIPDLNLQGLYELIESCYFSTSKIHSFVGCKDLVNHHDLGVHVEFRSRPIEYYSTSRKELFFGTGERYSHKYTYYALDSLKKIFKLDDFMAYNDLISVKDYIITSQFLELSHENHGAFAPSLQFDSTDPAFQNKKASLEYSYYAIKALEILTQALDLGDISTLILDRNALKYYLSNHTQSSMFMDSMHQNNVETILQHTYYMIYILKALGDYNLNDEEVRTYITQNIDYSNIKNIYYSFKISEILNFDINVDFHQTQFLIESLYSEDFNDYFLTLEKNELEHEVFLWVCDMAKNDEIKIEPNFSESVMLGGYNDVNVSLYNMVLDEFGPYTTVKFESTQIQSIVFDEMLDGTYFKTIQIPVEPTNYPIVGGNITVYDDTTLVAFESIFFNTNYDLEIINSTFFNDNHMIIQVDISLLTWNDKSPLFDSRVYAEIYKDDIFIKVENFSCEEKLDHSNFTLDYILQAGSNYVFKLFLEDPYQPTARYLFEVKKKIPGSEELVEIEQDVNSNEQPKYEENYQNALPIMLMVIAIPSLIIFLSSRAKRTAKSKI